MKRLMIPVIAISLTMAACSNDTTENDKETEERVTPVETAQVTKEDLEIMQQFYGRTMPESTVPVLASTPGEVEELNVENGDQVEEGDILATVQAPQSPTALEIEASASGEIASLAVQEGGMASNSEPMMTIVDMDNIIVELSITAEDLSLFEKSEEATVIIETADVEEKASITNVASVPGENGLYTVELTIGNENGSIKPGMTVVVSLAEQVVEQALIIPTAALVEQDDNTFVYRVENEQVTQVQVTVTESQSDQSAVEGELAEGNSIVVKGQPTLTDGSPVSVEKEEQ